MAVIGGGNWKKKAIPSYKQFKQHSSKLPESNTMKKPMNISEFAKIVCNIHSFSHDISGNPTALFDVEGYKMAIQNNPTAMLLESKRRRQVSYAGTELAYAKDALAAANVCFASLEFSHCSGSRSEDFVSVTFHVIK